MIRRTGSNGSDVRILKGWGYRLKAQLLRINLAIYTKQFRSSLFDLVLVSSLLLFKDVYECL